MNLLQFKNVLTKSNLPNFINLKLSPARLLNQLKLSCSSI